MTVDILPRKVLTLPDILAGLSDLAENGEGAQRAQAYRMLLGAGGTTGVELDRPLNRGDIIPRLARLMKPAGPEVCQLAYRRAFPYRQMKDVSDIEIEEYKAPDGTKLATTLKALFKVLPELKPRGGVPKGYPSRRGIEAKAAWCREQHLLVLRERELNEARKAVAQEQEIEA